MTKLVSMLLCLVALCAVVAKPANAGTLEDKVTFGEQVSHKLSVAEGGRFGNGPFGWSAFFLTSQYWSEGYAGPTWSPAKWATLSASVGLQSAAKGANPIRYAGSLWLGNQFGSVFSVYERGAEASNDWWKVKAFANVAKGVKAGVFLEKGKDAAPVLEVSIAKRFAVWGAYYKDAPQVGLKYNF